MTPEFRLISPGKLRTLADAIEAHERATRELWASSRAGTETEAQRAAFGNTKKAAMLAWRECFPT